MAPWSIQVRSVAISASLERHAFALRGHAVRAVCPGHPVDEQALAALARLDRRTTLAAAADELGGVETQPRLLSDRPVAARAPRGQDRLDLTPVIHRRRSQYGSGQGQDECHDHRLVVCQVALHLGSSRRGLPRVDYRGERRGCQTLLKQGAHGSEPEEESWTLGDDPHLAYPRERPLPASGVEVLCFSTMCDYHDVAAGKRRSVST